MKLLHTTGYSDQPFTIPVDRILSVEPCECKRNVLMKPTEITPGTRINVQDVSQDGCTFTVRETYETIIAKLEAM